MNFSFSLNLKCTSNLKNCKNSRTSETVWNHLSRNKRREENSKHLQRFLLLQFDRNRDWVIDVNTVQKCVHDQKTMHQYWRSSNRDTISVSWRRVFGFLNSFLNACIVLWNCTPSRNSEWSSHVKRLDIFFNAAGFRLEISVSYKMHFLQHFS